MRTFTITTDDANQRLDRFVRKLLPGAALALIYRLIRKGDIRIGGQRAERDTLVTEGDTVDIRLRDADIDRLLRRPETPTERTDTRRLDRRDIIYEDAHILVINKPAGINVHP